MPLLTGLMILALNVASGSKFLVKMERGNDVSVFLSGRTSASAVFTFASSVGQRDC